MGAGDWIGGLLAPRRRRGVEYLDDPKVSGRVARRSMADVARANRLFGGTRNVLAELDRALPALRAGAPRAPDGGEPVLTLLDIGTGIGDIPAAARARARRRGVRLVTLGLDASEALAAAARSPELPVVCGDALRLPFRAGSVDIAMCSQVLHHFARADGLALLRELHRVARGRVIVSDLRRSWLAAAGIWLASWALRFHPVSRHDGVVSVLRGFTRAELAELVREATGRRARVRRRLGWRVSAVWDVQGADGEPAARAARAAGARAPQLRDT